MNFMIIGIIVILVLVLVIIGIGFLVYIRIRDKVREVSRLAFGTSDVVEGVKRMEAEAASTPKSVSSATNMYLPRITKDFPEFHFQEMRERAESVLVSYLRSIDSLDASLLTEGTSEFREQLAMRIQMLRQAEQRECYRQIKVHRTEIHQYRKLKGKCSIVLQSAVEHIHYIEKDGKVIQGYKDRMKQTKYNVELIYIQDRDLVEHTQDTGLGLTCPNCGAPLPSLGAKICAYCDSPVIAINIHTWNFSDVTELT